MSEFEEMLMQQYKDRLDNDNNPMSMAEGITEIMGDYGQGNSYDTQVKQQFQSIYQQTVPLIEKKCGRLGNIAKQNALRQLANL